jgi:glycosyltransferase involved in cell wall biosynthesis
MLAFDAYVNSSAYEGISLTILEAMAAGLPVIATRVGGNPEVVLPDETGMLVPANAPASLAAAIMLLGNDSVRRHRMGQAGRWRVDRHFSIERMVYQYHSAYRHLVGGDCGARVTPAA